jgi:hypothetical protein
MKYQKNIQLHTIPTYMSIAGWTLYSCTAISYIFNLQSAMTLASPFTFFMAGMLCNQAAFILEVAKKDDKYMSFIPIFATFCLAMISAHTSGLGQAIFGGNFFSYLITPVAGLASSCLMGTILSIFYNMQDESLPTKELKTHFVTGYHMALINVAALFGNMMVQAVH